MFARYCLLILFACNGIVTLSVHADDLNWMGGQTFFSSAGNWDPTQSPGDADNLTFDASATAFDLNLASDMDVAGTSFLGGHYTMNGAPNSLLSSDGNRIDATVTATGANTKWAADGGLTVGDTGAGTLNIEVSAVVSHLGLRVGNTASGIGIVNVNNARLGTNMGSSVARIGVNGTGTMNVTGGGLSNASSAVIGDLPGSMGTVNVTGVASEFATHVSSTVVGDEGTGFLNLSAGGEVEVHVNDLIVGRGPTGVGSIQLDNGVANVASDVLVGSTGTGSFAASNGSSVSSRDLVVGRFANSQGAATFDQSELVTSREITIGWDGMGVVELRNGSSASSPSIYVGWNNNGDNRLEVTGGSGLTFGDADFFHIGTSGTGAFLMNGGSTLTGGHMKIAERVEAGVQSVGNATFSGTGTVANLRSLSIGNLGVATAEISGGARVNVNNDVDASVQQIFVGDKPGGEGTLTISGSDGLGNPSTLSSTDRIEISGRINAEGGTGVVNVIDGGELITNGGVIGRGAGVYGEANVSGTGSHWDSSGNGPLFLGFHGSGHLEVSGGGTVKATSLRVADIASTTSSLLLDGADSNLTVTGDSTIGLHGTGNVEIKDGATLTTNGDVFLGDESAGNARVRIDDATWNHEGRRIRIGNEGGTPQERVFVSVLNGSEVTTPELYIADNSPTGGGWLEVFESVVTTETSVIGDEGNGLLVVANGSLFEANRLDIGGQSGFGIANIVQDATVSVEGVLNVGRGADSTGRMIVGSSSRPATVGADTINIALASKSTGSILVHPFGSLFSSAELTVGGLGGNPGGTGLLNVEGTVDVGTELVVTPTGTVKLSAGSLKLSTLTRHAGSAFDFTGGKLELRGDHVFDSARLAAIFNEDAELSRNMSLEINGQTTLDAPLRLKGGSLAVGSINNLNNLGWETGLLRLGSALTVGTGGLVGDQLTLTSGQDLTVAGNMVNDGLINASGSQLTFENGMTNNGDLVLIDSTVVGPVINSADSTVTVLGQVDFDGSVNGDGDFSGAGAVHFNGGFSPGAEVAVATFDGDVVIIHSLTIEIGGQVNTQSNVEFDALEIAGTASLAGALNVELIDLGGGVFTPQVGNSFTILTADEGFSGSFSGINLPVLGNGLDWQFVAEASSLRLDVISQNAFQCDSDGDGDCDQADINAMYAAFGSSGPFDYDGNGTVGAEDITGWLADASSATGLTLVAGDTNLSGTVDSTDLGLLLNNFGATSNADWMSGDLNGDATVDSTDLGLLLNNFGARPAANAVAVPEPNGLIHTFLGLLLSITLCQQRRSSWMPCR